MIPILAQQVYTPVFEDALHRPVHASARHLNPNKFGVHSILRYAIQRYDDIAEENFACIYSYVPPALDDKVIDAGGNDVTLVYLELTDEVIAEVVRTHGESLHELPSDALFRLVREAEGDTVPEFLKKMVLGP